MYRTRRTLKRHCLRNHDANETVENKVEEKVEEKIEHRENHMMGCMLEGILNRIYGCMLGGIVGDALGSAYEFTTRDQYTVHRDMQANVFGLPPGSFTDDSSMMLCLAASFIEKKTFDQRDQMRRYAAWMGSGYMSSSDERGCFDIGKTTAKAIAAYNEATREAQRTGNTDDVPRYYGSHDSRFSGNGGIMRLAPVPIVYRNDLHLARVRAAESSAVTHASVECEESAMLMAEVIVQLLNGVDKKNLIYSDDYVRPNVAAIAQKRFLDKRRDEILTTGYVIHTLEAALWAFYTTESFEGGMMLLAGMGGDVDTVCCVYGQIAGACYGYDAIPRRWLNSLQKPELLADITVRIAQIVIDDREEDYFNQILVHLKNDHSYRSNEDLQKICNKISLMEGVWGVDKIHEADGSVKGLRVYTVHEESTTNAIAMEMGEKPDWIIVEEKEYEIIVEEKEYERGEAQEE